ncbi:hypothetical protein [Erythrobacter sp.]|uniref:hypothetical protein n=1 Tax=Erythrobacter sp. TaxID=1042 RepID=UPI0025E98AD7|nr:hypothetical protein [Erythrobacter sp.]
MTTGIVGLLDRASPLWRTRVLEKYGTLLGHYDHKADWLFESSLARRGWEEARITLADDVMDLEIRVQGHLLKSTTVRQQLFVVAPLSIPLTMCAGLETGSAVLFNADLIKPDEATFEKIERVTDTTLIWLSSPTINVLLG